jgi:hypothetical protein
MGLHFTWYPSTISDAYMNYWNPHRSVLKASLKLGLPYPTVHGVLHKRLKLNAYKSSLSLRFLFSGFVKDVAYQEKA